jgi:creatinine amidohydrolase
MRTLLTTATSHDVASLQTKIAVLPVGSFEQHGGVLPLITDTVVAQLIADRIAEDYGLFLLPPITISCSHEHAGFAGTVSISSQTLYAVVADIRASLIGSGIDKLVLVNGHGGNYVLSNIAQEANVSEPRIALFPGRVEWQRARDDAGLETTMSEDMHAGELEVSLLMHAVPDLVAESRSSADHLAIERPHLLMTGLRGLTASGVIGRPSLGTAEKGATLLGSLSKSFASFHALLSQ